LMLFIICERRLGNPYHFWYRRRVSWQKRKNMSVLTVMATTGSAVAHISASEPGVHTVREDYSEDGNAWMYFPHDQAHSRTYRWNEDGLAGISDDEQMLCFALALWNGQDPILKERLFGLAGPEGNHGEDIKEYYFYLDS